VEAVRPYLAERQWGTVREDYSAGGDAWGSFRITAAREDASWQDDVPELQQTLP